MGFFSELKSDLSEAGEVQDGAQAAFDAADELAAEMGAVTGTEDSVGEVHFDTPTDTDPAYSFVDTINQLTADAATETDADDFEEEPASEINLSPVSGQDALSGEEAIPTVTETATSNYHSNEGGFKMDIETGVATDETAVVTEGMTINGDLQTTGNLDMIGKVDGNVTCYGKLNVTGEITGDSSAAEIYAEAARITGEVRSNGTVKIGQSTVIIGNVFATSAVIAGAVKGDIDVHGPVVLDTTAIVMGNIKSQSVQINNGAVIEGMCSQTYAEVNPQAFFDGLK